jgi:hypothetical protein
MLGDPSTEAALEVTEWRAARLTAAFAGFFPPTPGAGRAVLRVFALIVVATALDPVRTSR